jgi:hypothetical protein
MITFKLLCLTLIIGSVLFSLYRMYKEVPRFKIGDEIYYSATDFPELDSYIIITGIGTDEYQYRFNNGTRKYTNSISYINNKFSLLPGGKNERIKKG